MSNIASITVLDALSAPTPGLEFEFLQVERKIFTWQDWGLSWTFSWTIRSWSPTFSLRLPQPGLLAPFRNDWVIGTAGDDTLDGGAGADTMVGGAGNDIYYVDNAGDVIVEDYEAKNTDWVFSSVDYSLGANLEALTLQGSAILGNGNELSNIVKGNSQNNILSGGAGDDSISGELGADTMIGGTGRDQYDVDDIGDVIIENDDNGEADDVFSSINYTLGANVENLFLWSDTAIVGSGNELSNYISGSYQNNQLNGGDGNDTLDGGAGDDILDGETGTDTMFGGTGNDVYYVDNAGDVVSENANEGIDTVRSFINYTLTANVEDLYLKGSAIAGTGNGLGNKIYGNSLNNSLTGGGGNDTLDGGAGTDTLIGGVGDDVYYINVAGDVITENAGEGIDTVYSSANIINGLAANVENLVLMGNFSYAVGNAQNNHIIGNAVANTLDGVSGFDTLEGGLGNDTYYVYNPETVVIEAAGAGTDTLYVANSGNYTMAANVEDVFIISFTGPVNVIGNSLNNVMYGNAQANRLTGEAGNDILEGAQGADTLLGGVGNDTYSVDNTADLVIEFANEGIDTVYASVNWTLDDNLENLTLGGSASKGGGNTLDNVIQGNAANNVLNGGSGSDTLTGGAGADKFEFGSAQTGRDTVTDFASGVDLIVLSGFGLDALVEGYNFIVNSGPVGEYATLIYNTATGILTFDEDGTGAAAGREIALFSTKPALTVSDFYVY